MGRNSQEFPALRRFREGMPRCNRMSRRSGRADEFVFLAPGVGKRSGSGRDAVGRPRRALATHSSQINRRRQLPKSRQTSQLLPPLSRVFPRMRPRTRPQRGCRESLHAGPPLILRVGVGVMRVTAPRRQQGQNLPVQRLGLARVAARSDSKSRVWRSLSNVIVIMSVWSGRAREGCSGRVLPACGSSARKSRMRPLR